MNVRQLCKTVRVCLWKMERELCPFARFTLYLDGAPMCLYDATRDGESQPCAAASLA